MTTMLVIQEIKILPVSVNFLYQCQPSDSRRVSSHKVLYLYSLVHMSYLSACNRDLFLKVTIAMFCFCRSRNPSNIMKDIFNSISIYSLKKCSLFIRKINLFFDVMKHDQIVPSKVCCFQYGHRLFLVEKWGTGQEVRLQKFIKTESSGQYSF